jgi:NADH:ubiquinone oxidoreductase subunit 3 (subunit A)
MPFESKTSPQERLHDRPSLVFFALLVLFCIGIAFSPNDGGWIAIVMFLGLITILYYGWFVRHGRRARS